MSYQERVELTMSREAFEALVAFRRPGEELEQFLLRFATAARASGQFADKTYALDVEERVFEGEAPAPEGLELAESFIVPKEKARAFPVYEGQVLRIIEVEGPQTADFNAYVLPDLSERFSAGRTRFFTGVHPRKGDALYTNPPHDRVMFRIVEDTVEHRIGPHGATQHDLLFPRCSKIVFDAPFGIKGHPSCQDSFAEAIADEGLTPDDVHDTFNVFMKTGVDPAGNIFIESPDAVQGDYVDLLCVVDSLVVISSCPASDVHATSGTRNKPLKIEIYG